MTAMTATQGLIQTVFRKEVLALSAYHVADAQGMIKLDAMENPYRWPEEITAQWLERLHECHLNRYPDPDASQLTATLKRMNNISDHYGCLLYTSDAADE